LVVSTGARSGHSVRPLGALTALAVNCPPAYKQPMSLSPELVALLACPKCKGKLALRPDESAFVCGACKLVYAVVDQIPNFIIEEATPLAPTPGGQGTGG
jgi:uncharacterized protein YbaR (Trm112 family)